MYIYIYIYIYINVVLGVLHVVIHLKNMVNFVLRLFKFLPLEQAQKSNFQMAPLPSVHHRRFGG